nr:endonuclease domain-containing protein [Brevundimonas sp.]
MRRPMSPPEARLWVRVRARRLEGCKFRRQHPCGPFILDFYCAAARLAVEVDGESHNHPDQISHDRRRTRWLAAQGIRVVRIAAVDVRDELDGVLAFILRVVRERTAHRSAAPSTPRAKSPGRSSSPSLTGR